MDESYDNLYKGLSSGYLIPFSKEGKAMKINPTASIFNRRNLFGDTTCGLKTAEKKDKTKHTDSYMKGLSQTGKDKDPDADKLQEILNKAKSGKKLTQEELDFLREKSPDNYRKIVAAMQQREMLRQQMEAAKSRMEAEQIYMSHMSAAQSTKDEIVLAQLKGEHDETVLTDEFAEKPLTAEEERNLPEAEKKKRKKHCHAPVGPLHSPRTTAKIIGGLIDIKK